MAVGDTTHPNARNAGDKCAHICVTEHFQRIVKKDIMENWWDKKLSKKNIGGGGAAEAPQDSCSVMWTCTKCTKPIYAQHGPKRQCGNSVTMAAKTGSAVL